MEYKLFSWNINGIRATQEPLIELLNTFQPTVLSLQETKAEPSQLPANLVGIPPIDDFFSDPADTPPRLHNYNTHWVYPTIRKGYSGVANFVAEGLKPTNIRKSSKDYAFDEEGRILSMEFEHFVLFNIYFPNGEQNEERLQHKLNFYDRFFEVCEALQSQGKSIVLCGDINTAHKAIDLYNPDDTRSGFMPEERAWLDKWFEWGFVDTYRHFNPDKEGAYTFWAAKDIPAKEENRGWRIDYYLISKDLLPNLKSAEIHADFLGSDHCPISITLQF